MDRKMFVLCFGIALSSVAACSDDNGSGAMTAPPPGSSAAGATVPAAPTTSAAAAPGMTSGQSTSPQTTAGSSAQPTQPSQPAQQPMTQPTMGAMQPAQAGSGAATKPGDTMPAGTTPAGMTPADMTPKMGTLPPVMSTKDKGPYEVTIEMGEADGGGWVAHPKDMGKDGVKHPIFVFGCGGGSQPSQYMDHMTLIASHGFVMESHVSNGEATDHSKPLEWLLKQNETEGSKYYQKLDTTKIAAGGHSMGSIATFAFEATTDKLTTSIHVAGGSFDGNGFMSLKTPTLFVEGEGDTLAGENTARDFEKTTVPTFYVNIDDSDHIYAARDGLPVIIAWLRWKLAGEEERAASFTGASCEFCGAPWHGMVKNWK